MIKGNLALGGLSLEFGNAQDRFDELAGRIRALTASHEKLMAEERELIEELARIYLPELTPETVSESLRELRAHLETTLDEQDDHLRRLTEQLAGMPSLVQRFQTRVDDAEQAEAAAAALVDTAREAVVRELGTDPEHNQRVEGHQALMERRSILKTRRVRLQSTANVERFRYEENRAFAYLLRRKFGEPEYHGGVLTRRLDRWLARRTDYATLSRHYRVLKIGPHAIQAEIRRITERAEVLEREIDDREAEAGDRAGLVTALGAGALAQEALVEERAALAEATARRDALRAELRAVQANRGGPYEEALATYRDYLESRRIRELEAIARSTPDPRDDALVARLEDLRARVEEAHGDLVVQRRELERQASRTGSLADIVRDAASRFSSRRSFFPEHFELKKLVQSVVDGDATSEDALGRIAHAHVPRQVIDPTGAEPLRGWFAELSSAFDPELDAVTVHVEHDVDIEHEIVVEDADGRVLHRRVTRRRVGGSRD